MENIKKLKELLDNINVNKQNIYGWTALMMAAIKSNSNRNSNEETMKLLIESGPDVNKQNKDGWTALMYAAEYSSDVETVKLLIESGADPFMLSKEKKSALDYCPTKECKEIIAKRIWRKMYETDKMVANKLNKRISIGKDVWEIIMLKKRLEMLCKKWTSNKKVIIEFGLEWGIPMEEIKKMNKRQLCGIISKYLVYGKNTNIEKVVKKWKKVWNKYRSDKILEELSKIINYFF